MNIAKRTCNIFLPLLICLFVSTAKPQSALAFDPAAVYGPRIEKLCMVIVRNSDAQVLAVERGDADVISELARPSDIERLSRNPKLKMSLARGFHAFFILLNNEKAPWNDKYVRQAAAEAIDRNNIVRTIYSGYCEPINSWLPPVSPWALPESTKTIFDRDSARSKLKSRGYSWNISGLLVAPDGKALPHIKLLTPLANVAPTTAEMAEQAADSLRAVGFPVDVEPMDFSAMVAKLDRKDYSMAVLAWSMGRNPDSLYAFYHSSMSAEGGYNMTGTKDKALDAELSKLRFAKDKKEAEAASAKVQLMLADIMPSIPIYSRFSVASVSNSWKNILTTEKVTADNMWSFLMAEPKDGRMRTMNVILPEEPRNLNPFTASTAYSWQVLGMIYEGMTSTNPFTLEDMPGIAESWSVKSAANGENMHTELVFKFKNGLKWNDGSAMTASDMKVTIDFLRRNKIPRFFDSVKDVENVSVSGNTLTVRMKGVSYWYLDNIGGLPCMPKKILDKISDWQNWNPIAKDGKTAALGLIGCGPFMLDEYRAGEYVMMKKNPHYRMLDNRKDNLK